MSETDMPQSSNIDGPSLYPNGELPAEAPLNPVVEAELQAMVQRAAAERAEDKRRKQASLGLPAAMVPSAQNAPQTQPYAMETPYGNTANPVQPSYTGQTSAPVANPVTVPLGTGAVKPAPATTPSVVSPYPSEPVPTASGAATASAVPPSSMSTGAVRHNDPEHERSSQLKHRQGRKHTKADQRSKNTPSAANPAGNDSRRAVRRQPNAAGDRSAVQTAKPRRWKVVLVLALVLAIGFGIGSCAGSSHPKKSQEYKDLNAQYMKTERELQNSRDSLASMQAQLANLSKQAQQQSAQTPQQGDQSQNPQPAQPQAQNEPQQPQTPTQEQGAGAQSQQSSPSATAPQVRSNDSAAVPAPQASIAPQSGQACTSEGKTSADGKLLCMSGHWQG